MVRLFIDALTKSGPEGVPKPIETYAQDKKRYVGDMLAWLRQYIPTEKENFILFLKDCNLHKPGKNFHVKFITLLNILNIQIKLILIIFRNKR